MKEYVSSICALPMFCVSQCACESMSYPDIAVLAEGAPEVIWHIGRFCPQNGGETTECPAALGEQADAVTEFGLDELECRGDSVVVIRTDTDETQRRIAHQSLLLRGFCQSRCKESCCRPAVTSVVNTHCA